MLVEAITPPRLLNFIRTELVNTSFVLMVHIITEPFISTLCELPPSVRRSSVVYLDGEKAELNSYAVKRLTSCGYKVYYVNKLHAKLLLAPQFTIVSTANFTERSLKNHELVLVVWSAYEKIDGINEVVNNIVRSAYPAK